MLCADDVKDEMGEEARWNVGSDEDRGSHGIEDRMSEKLSWIIGRQQDRQEGRLGRDGKESRLIFGLEEAWRGCDVG